MYQEHKMLLWAPPKKEDKEQITDKIVNLLNCFKEHEIYFPYVYVHKSYQLFNINHLEVSQILKTSKVSKSSEELGYGLSFVSSLDLENCASLSIIVGIFSQQFINSIIIDISEDYFYNMINSNKIESLFCNCVLIGSPFWGAIVNQEILDKYHNGSYWKKEKLCSVHWINYFSGEMLCRIQNIIPELPQSCIYNSLGDGIFLQISKQPINLYNEDDIHLQKSINRMLKLDCTGG